jgi:Predicted membrane protein
MKQPQKQQGGVLLSQQTYEGPLPPPKVLDAYEKIYPGAAREIIELAKKAQDHKIDMDRQAARYALRDSMFGFILGVLGQIGVLLITLGGFCMAYFYIKAGEPKLAYLTASSSTVICGYLIWWKTRNVDQDSTQKQENT